MCASAIEYYVSRGEEVVTEETIAGDGLLANLCVDWEARADSVKDRYQGGKCLFGLILSQKGGILKLLTLASYLKVGMGAVNGSNVFTWVSIEDVVGSILYSICNTIIRGPINMVSLSPMQASDFFVLDLNT